MRDSGSRTRSDTLAVEWMSRQVSSKRSKCSLDLLRVITDGAASSSLGCAMFSEPFQRRARGHVLHAFIFHVVRFERVPVPVHSL